MSNEPRDHTEIKYHQSFVAKNRSQSAQGSLSLGAFDDGFVEAQSSDWFTRRRRGEERAEMFLEFRSIDSTGNKFGASPSAFSAPPRESRSLSPATI